MFFRGGGKTVPQKNDVLVQIPGAHQQEQALPATFDVLVWNVEKGKEANYGRDMKKLGQGKHLILLQEFVTSPVILEALKLPYELATSFIYSNKERAGAATGAVAVPVKIDFQITEDTEPLVGTPKPTIFTTYAIGEGGKKQLLVVNLHGINRAGFEPFQKQLRAIAGVVKDFEGPVIWGGDFNTNSK
jgi:endonuclease/exonuclease/phosphatase (EEP) superfamily protein YafD